MKTSEVLIQNTPFDDSPTKPIPLSSVCIQYASLSSTDYEGIVHLFIYNLHLELKKTYRTFLATLQKILR